MYWDPDEPTNAGGRLFTTSPMDAALTDAARAAGRWLVKATIRPLALLLNGF